MIKFSEVGRLSNLRYFGVKSQKWVKIIDKVLWVKGIFLMYRVHNCVIWSKIVKKNECAATFSLLLIVQNFKN
jgi:hypothetical protein